LGFDSGLVRQGRNGGQKPARLLVEGEFAASKNGFVSIKKNIIA
jgi:hypothetical protein